MGEPLVGAPPSERPPEGRLDSWKEIAAYLNRDVTTAQRWEKREAMPVHRHLARQDGLGPRFPVGVGRLGARSKSAGATGERERRTVI